MMRGRPFIGSVEIAAGSVTKGALRGARFRRLFQDVYLDADVPITYPLLCEAAALAVRATSDTADGTGSALAGWAAAEMLGADCAPDGVPAEVQITAGSRRGQPRLLVHRGGVLPGEIVTGVRIPDPVRKGRFLTGRTVTVTSALRTAFDLARREERIEAVIALDALARVGGFRPADVLDLAARHPGVRGVTRLPDLVALANPLAESAMETRVRLALHDGGLPPPVLQHPVGRFRIDLAYPELLLGIEYDGAHHRTAEQARDDLERQAFLAARGWRILRPVARDVFRAPAVLADRVRAELVERDMSAPSRALA